MKWGLLGIFTRISCVKRALAKLLEEKVEGARMRTIGQIELQEKPPSVYYLHMGLSALLK